MPRPARVLAGESQPDQHEEKEKDKHENEDDDEDKEEKATTTTSMTQIVSDPPKRVRHGSQQVQENVEQRIVRFQVKISPTLHYGAIASKGSL